MTFTEAEAVELSSELHPGASDFEKAMLEQTRALTLLVSQLASNTGDPMQDLGSSSSSLSSRGAMGRAKLQNELAAHKGVFFHSVIQHMARRMQPAQQADAALSELRQRGVTPSQYLERFGGFGRTRDLGFIIWQVALCMNHMQESNHLAAMDSLSLLFVCLEQAAMDGGSLQVGLLLSLTEDPPQSLFTGRSIAAGAQPRAFAPTASQKWITIALQYLKEMDVISTRRSEITGGKASTDSAAAASSAAATAAPTPKRKAKAKGGGRGKSGSQSAQPAEEEQ